MKLSISKTAHAETQICFLTKNNSAGVADFEAGKKEVTVRYEGKTAIIYCGLGEDANVSAAIIRKAAASGVRRALELKRTRVSVTPPAQWEPALEGIVLGSYSYDKYKTEKKQELVSCELVSASVTQAQAARVVALCECVNYSRDLVNENAHIANPEYMANEARVIAKKGGMTVTILTEKEILQKGLRLLYAVGQGSEYPPRLAIIEYRGNKASKDTTMIVGKGITFDSGGQNLKPTGHIETMRSDMAGAAAVLGTMKALSIVKPKINVTGVCPCAHNAIGDHAYFPGDVYKAYNGTTVEIESTDAEGRLVLADAIAYCNDKYKPSRIIDLATLTGGILYALGSTVAGLFSNNDELAKKLFDAGEATNERLWQFPLYEEYVDSVKSDIADLRNVSTLKKGYASSITGAAFIQSFAGKTPWAHLDIAGTAFNEEGARGELPQFATGFGVRLLLTFLGI